jgi:hypothetical protein
MCNLRHNVQLTESGQYLVEVEYTINSLELHNNEWDFDPIYTWSKTNILMLGVSILPLVSVFLIGFRTVSTVCFFLILFHRNIQQFQG